MDDRKLREFLRMVRGEDVRFVRYHRGEPLKKHCTFRIGGPAEIFIEAFLFEDVAKIMRFCSVNDVPSRVIGGGSNLLISDRGLDGLVVKLSPGTVLPEVAGSSGGRWVSFKVHAGLSAKRLLSWCVRSGLSGCEFLAGIPATIGGAVKMNAGTPEGCMADVVEKVEIVDSEGKRRVLDYLMDCRPSYRFADIPQSCTILSVTLKLLPSDSIKIRKKIISIMKDRLQKQPLGYPSAGCVFRNPAPNISAGYLIDLCGLKGMRVGDAEVSPKHANWIVNRGKATAEDVLKLIELVKQRVFDTFGITLREEIEVWS